MRRAAVAGLTVLLSFPLLATATTRFIDRDGNAIDEIRVEGNRAVTAYEIRNALGHGPDDFATAVMVMKAILPYFKSVDWSMDEEDGRRIATVRVAEYALNAVDQSLIAAFNRAHGVRLGSRMELERRRRLREPPRGKLFAEASYGFSNERWNHKFGGSTDWNVGKTAQLTATVQHHRLTAIRDEDAMPNNGEQVYAALVSGTDFRDYFERTGTEISARLTDEARRHTMTASVLAERHRSLFKASDWSLFSWRAPKNPITPVDEGELASVQLRYDFDGREDVVFPTGWRPSVEIEHAAAQWGSDFPFTRIAANIRRYDRLGDDFVRLRLKWLRSWGDAPMQRQLIVGGPGTLRGYDLFEFAGSRGALFNGEYRRHVFGNSYVLFFADLARYWRGTNAATDGLKATLGYGFAFEGAIYLRVARALESGRASLIDLRVAQAF